MDDGGENAVGRDDDQPAGGVIAWVCIVYVAFRIDDDEEAMDSRSQVWPGNGHCHVVAAATKRYGLIAPDLGSPARRIPIIELDGDRAALGNRVSAVGDGGGDGQGNGIGGR